MKIMVFGAGGMLGRDVIRSAEAAGHEAIPVPHEEADVTDFDAVHGAVGGARPDVVVNCAAWTDVDGAEEAEEEATRINGEGAGNVAAAAAEADAAVLYPSTDYVFDGSKGAPYVESDPVAPLSAYGRGKLAGERATAQANPRHRIVRTQWLFGVAGGNFVETMLRLGAERDELTVVSDQVGCPTYTGHLAAALIGLIDRGDWDVLHAKHPARPGAHDILHLAGGGQCSWYEFAKAIFERANVDCRVVPGNTAELGRPAPRPADAVLRSEHRDAPGLPIWEVGLDRYLSERPAMKA